MRKLCIILLSVFIASGANGQTVKGKEFWVGFMENISLAFNGVPVFRLHIFSEANTTCTVSVPYTGYTHTLSVGANQVSIFEMPAGIYYPAGDEATANNGILVVSSDSVIVYAYHHRIYFTESTCVLPYSELGAEYIVTAVTDTYSNAPSEFIVLATENNTTVEIVPNAITMSTRPAGVPFHKVLNRGQVYQIQSMNDLTGSIVRSTDTLRKIAVFGGARQARVGCYSGADDHVYDQMLPVSSFAKKYHVIPFSGHLFDVVKVVAAHNNTQIWTTLGHVFTLNKGASAEFTVAAPCKIEANKGISVAQIATSLGCNGPPQTATGDPGMIMLAPDHLSLKNSVFYTTPSLKLGATPDYFELHRLNIMVKSSAVSGVVLDNTPVPSSSFTPFMFDTAYSYARIIFDTLGILQHTLSCDSGFSALIYSFPYANFYGHHLGYHNPKKAAVIDPDTPISEIATGIRTTVFPVPVRGILNLKTERNVDWVEVYDATGTRVLKAKNFSRMPEIDVSDLPSGIYFCVVKYHDEPRAAKPVKFVIAND